MARLHCLYYTWMSFKRKLNILSYLRVVILSVFPKLPCGNLYLLSCNQAHLILLQSVIYHFTQYFISAVFKLHFSECPLMPQKVCWNIISNRVGGKSNCVVRAREHLFSIIQKLPWSCTQTENSPALKTCEGLRCFWHVWDDEIRSRTSRLSN